MKDISKTCFQFKIKISIYIEIITTWIIRYITTTFYNTTDRVVTYLFHDRSPDGGRHPSILLCKLLAVTRATKLTLIPRLHDTTGCQTDCQTGLYNRFEKLVVQPGLTTCWTNSGCSSNRLSNRVVQPIWQPVFYNRFDNRLYRVYKHSTGLSNRFDNRFDNRLHRVNGA